MIFYNSIRWCIYVTFPTKLISTKLCNALTKHERVTFLWDTKLILEYLKLLYISSNLSTAIPIPVWSSLRRRKLSQWLKINWYWPLLLLLYTKHNIARVTLLWETKCYTCLRNQTLRAHSLELENSPKVMWSFYNSIRWCIYVTFPTKLISTKLCNAFTTYKAWTCNIFVRHQTILEYLKLLYFLLIYQLQFLFLCDQVLGGESYHNGLKSIDTDHYCCCYTKHNIARVTLFCEKPNVTRASMFNKSYYKIMPFVDKVYWMHINEPIISL